MFVRFWKIIASWVAIFIVVCQPQHLFAAEEELKIANENINPGSILYSFKRLWEKSSEKFIFDDKSRVSFHESLLKKRLAELRFVVEGKHLGEVQTSSERFAYQAGILTNNLLKTNNGKEVAINEFNQLTNTLNRLRDAFPANSSFWMLVQHDINTLKILSDQLMH